MNKNKATYKLLIILLVLITNACSNKVNCDNISSEEKLLQEYGTSTGHMRLTYIDQGALGGYVKLRICDKRNILVEEVSMRGEDYYPIIDSVKDENVSLHYEMPTSQIVGEVTTLNKQNVFLGETLLNRDKLKYKYCFSNVVPDSSKQNIRF